ncbi:MAG: N-acetylmuramoyl-L-alanine amidase [Actinobacteria bacterium]|nr:N-acetylmuramoyl-L-alanine amidase [Actinomycetota bacterium]
MFALHAIASLLAALTLAGSHGSAPAPAPAQPAKRLAGMVVGIDPGHNGGNFADPGFINRPVWNGREMEACDTTGTATDGGYTEAQFNFNVATYLRADLVAEGAKVVMTRTTNHGVGPCIDRRAEILNKAGTDVAIDIHADGGPPGGRGVAILTPVADGPNDKVIGASRRFARILLGRYTAMTGVPISNYDGTDGLVPRDNLAGLNLTTVPKVLIECVNMRNAAEAARLVKPSFQRRAAASMAAAITAFLRPR